MEYIATFPECVCPKDRGAAGNELVKIVMPTCMLSAYVTKKVFYGIPFILAPLVADSIFQLFRHVQVFSWYTAALYA
jgi:hypothetical protein